MGGTPLLANNQSALLFPLNWPFYFLPLYLGFTVSALLKMFIASLATYAFARKISLSHPVAVLAGTTYPFPIFNIFWLNHPHTNVTLFLPLLLLLAERAKETPGPSSMATMALAVGVQLLGGHVEIAFHVAVAVTLFFLFRLIEYRKDKLALLLEGEKSDQIYLSCSKILTDLLTLCDHWRGILGHTHTQILDQTVRFG